MNQNLLRDPGKDIGEYPPRHKNGYYDVEKSLEHRYHNHLAMPKWRTKLSEVGRWLVSLEQRLIHKPYALTHPHAKPVPIHRHIHK